MSIFPTRILVATDGSEEAELAAASAANLAQKTGSELHMVHVFGIAPVGPPVYPKATEVEGVEQEAEAEQLQRISERRGREVLDAEVEKVRSDGGTVVEAHLIEGRVAPEIVALAEKIGTGLIVLGSRGRGGVRRALMGSVSDSVVRHAHCPVMVVRSAPVVFPTKIVVATDRSREAELASRTAADLANTTGSELHVVHVAHMEPVFATDPEIETRAQQMAQEARELLDEQAGRIESAGGTLARAHLQVGKPDSEITDLADELGVGLIILGSRGLGGIRRALMGSVSNSVVQHAHCPVMVVRPEKERTTEHEANSLMIIRAELPGVKPEDVDISLQNNVLTISGQRKAEQEEERGGYYIRERRYGSFSRSFTLPQGTNESKVHEMFVEAAPPPPALVPALALPAGDGALVEREGCNYCLKVGQP